jgi:Fe-S cluster biosynthesis and repair protein YggX
VASSVSKQHPELFTDDAPPVFTDDVRSKAMSLLAKNNAEYIQLIYSDKPDKAATFWDEKGNTYIAVGKSVVELKREIGDGEGLSDADGKTLNILSRVFREIREQDPAIQEQQRIEKIKRTEINRRQRRLQDVPKMPADFDTALQELADWAENFEEFKAALTPDMFDISDRNLTRLGRATMALEPDEYETAGRGDVTIYRALPQGEEIEAGDWVSFNEDYAAGHETNVGEEGGETISVEVSGEEVYWYGADENEWVYIPEGTWHVDSLEELWDNLTEGKKPLRYKEEFFQPPLPIDQISTNLGIEVQELTDQEQQDAIDLFAKLEASRAALKTEGSDGRTVAGTAPKEAWAGKTAILNEGGKPALVYRGSTNPLQPNRFDLESLGKATGFPPSGLGVWFTSNPDEASGYGPHVEPFHLDIRNPKVFEVAGDEDLPDFDTVADANGFREYLREQGHDGIVIDLRDIGEGYHAVAFDAVQAIRPVKTFYQKKEQQKNLFVAHNLSAKNILAAADLGGLAAPSIAVARSDISDFTGFGEVTLLADPSLLQDPKARTFDADIYSPRQPRATYDIDQNKYSELYKQLNENLSRPDISTLESTTGADDLLRSTAVEYHWLQLQGKAPALKPRKVEPLIKKADKLGINQYDMIEDEMFVKLVTDHYRAMVKKLESADKTRAERYDGFWFDEDGNIQRSKLRDVAASVRLFREEGGNDYSKLSQDIGKKMRDKKTRAAYEQWVTEQFNSMVKGKTLFKGFTPSGSRKYIPYSMQNVVKEMTQALQAGESTFYGVGTVRSKYANELKTIAAIQAKREQIVTEAEMEKVKEESQNVLSEALDALKPFYRFDAESWGYSEDAGNAIIEGRKGLNEAFKMATEAQKIVDDLIEYLTALPTSYFESKIQRAVQFSEFNTAIVPKGMRDDALQVLKNAGLKIKTYDAKKEGARAEMIAKQQKLLFQPARGSIQFLDDITTGPSIITLFENADLSTFTHESAHFFFEVMTDIASREDAPKEVIDDFNILLDWYGVKDMEEWLRLSQDSRRDHHEKFARGFEAYLFEGKAPSVELHGVFTRFRSWLVSVYKSIRALDVELTDEVRGVMDRLLATDDQIKVAEASNNYKPLFDSMEQARMTKSEWDAYQNADDEAVADAQRDLDTRSLRDMKWLAGAKSRALKALQNEGAAKRAAVRAEVADELANEPVYQATKYFKTGETTGPDGEEIKVTQGNKLNKEQILALFPPAELAAVDLKKLKGMTSVGEGMDIDLAGQIFGFSNGDQLVKAILAAPVLNDAIEQRTDEVVLERYGDISSQAALEEAANEAVHSEARGRFIASEVRALNRQLGSKTEIVKAAKEYAAEKIAGKKVRDARLPGKYRAAEARAARDAETALKNDDIVAAAQHKRAQVLNLYMARAATDAATEIDNAVNYLKKFERESVRKKLRGDMVEQLDSLLARFDLRKSPPKEGERVTLSEWVKAEADRLDAIIPDLDPIATNEGYRKHYKDLTLDELRGLKDTVKQMEHMARREERMYQERRALGFEQEKQAILNELSKAHPEAFDEEGLPKPYRKDRLPLVKDLRAKFRNKFDAEFINVENILDIMTLGEGDQIFDSIFGRLSEAADAQTRMMKDLAVYLKTYTEAYTRKERLAFSMATSRVFVPEVGEYFTRDKRVAVAMFYGSLDGRQRLADGNGYSDHQIKAIMRTLTDKDLDFINSMWAMSDEKIWPELKALDERTKGVPAKKITPAPFVVNGRVMTGGYTPLVYDGDLSTRSYDLNSDNAIAEMRGGSATQATTRQSASKQRLQEVKRPLDLSVSAISYKINETVHDITHREAVTDTYRLLKSSRLSNAIRSIAGPDVYKALLVKVRETAVNPVVPRGVTEKTLWYLRRNTMINMMGASFNTFAINVLGVSPSIRRVGPARFLRAVQKFASKDAVKRYQWVIEKSPYMRERIDGFDRDLNTEVNRFTGKAGIMPSMGVWFAGLAMMDRMVTLPTWMAAYEKAMDETGNNEELSIKSADRIVRQTQGSGRAIDLAKVSGGVGAAGEFKRIITMYYNFFSGQLGMMVRSKRLAEKEWNEGRRIKAAMEMTLTTLMVIVVPATLEAIARGNCGDDPEADDYLFCAGRSSALFGASMFPLVRDIVPFAWHQFDPETMAFGVRLSPVENAMETLARTPNSAADAIGGDATDSDIRTIIRGLGYAFGLPGFQASRTIEGYQAFMDGETDNPAAMLTGAPR